MNDEKPADFRELYDQHGQPIVMPPGVVLQPLRPTRSLFTEPSKYPGRPVRAVYGMAQGMARGYWNGQRAGKFPGYRVRG